MKPIIPVFFLSVLLLSGVFMSGCGKKVEVKEMHTTIVFLGDSITFGYGLDDPSKSFYGRIDAIMKAGIYDNVRTINAGVNGDDTGEALARIANVRAHDPDIVVIAFGLNDCQNVRITLLKFRQNLIRIIMALPKKTRVILATSNSFMDTGQEQWKELNASLDDYMDEVRKLSREKGYSLIDVHSVWKKQLRTDSRHIETLYVDPTHPSELGHKLLFETYMDVLRKMIVQ